jgi:hypothetical protein
VRTITAKFELVEAFVRYFGPDPVQSIRDALVRAGVDATDASTFETIRLLAVGLGVAPQDTPIA